MKNKTEVVGHAQKFQPTAAALVPQHCVNANRAKNMPDSAATPLAWDVSNLDENEAIATGAQNRINESKTRYVDP